MIGILIVIIFVIAGILTGLNVVVPYSYSQYIAVAILACLDSVFGAFSANIEKKFKMNVFLTGFFGNSLIAIFLVYLGNKLNVDLYLGAVIVFTGRLLTNFTVIRHDALGKFNDNKSKFIIKSNEKKSAKSKTNKDEAENEDNENSKEVEKKD